MRQTVGTPAERVLRERYCGKPIERRIDRGQENGSSTGPLDFIRDGDAVGVIADAEDGKEDDEVDYRRSDVKLLGGPSYIRSFDAFCRLAAFSVLANSEGQSDARRPPRQEVRRGGLCRRSYMTSGLPQMAFIRRSSGEGMP